MAVTAAAYYIGAWVGIQLRLPPATTSVVWPPNAILTALLLFVPLRRWWSVLLGAAIAHFAAQLQLWSPGFVSAIFISNCTEAFLAAGVIRYVSDQPDDFSTLHRITVFLLGAALVAPFVSSFVDAAVVRLFHGEDYWTVWRLRFPSSVLAQMIVVPAIAAGLNMSHSVREWSSRRWLEAAVITGGLGLAAGAVLLDAGQLGLPRSPLSPFLPLLLWCAVRFGSGGVALSVLATVLVAVVSTLYGAGLFHAVPPEARIDMLQVFLISATAPLMCVGALVEERRRSAAALQASDTLKATILASFPSHVAVVNRDGQVVAANEGWIHDGPRQISPAALVSDADRSGGKRDAAGADREHAGAAASWDEVKHVLDGSARGLNIEYVREREGINEWWAMSVVPLKSADGGAVITHTDISARKRAEITGQRSRDELARAARTWAMGALSASLSHQLNQPLTAIIGNAQAGRRFLETAPPNLVEVRHILTDVIADADRASDIIRAIRDLLRKDTFESQLVDVNRVVHDVAMLVNGEAAARNVTVRLALASVLPLVPGGRVLLSQVVLNLVMNAIEAATGPSAADGGTVIVRTVLAVPAGIQLSVSDSGPGLPRDVEEEIFEPLYSTKESGMGVGLTIARSIVEAHGGIIWADNSPAGGAAFHVNLPLSRHERP